MTVSFEVDAQNRPRQVQLAFAEPSPEFDAAPAHQPRQFAELKRPVAQVTSRPSQSQYEDEPASLSLWNPVVIRRWAILCSVIFGAWLCAKNWHALGDEKKARKSMYWVYVGIPVYLVVTIIPDGGLLATVFLIIWLFGSSVRQQVKSVEEKYNNTYIKKTWGKPIGIAVAVSVIVSLVMHGGSLPSLPFSAAMVSKETDSPSSSGNGEFRLEIGIEKILNVQYVRLIMISGGQETIRKITVNHGGCKTIESLQSLPTKLKPGESVKLLVVSSTGQCDISEVVVNADSGSYKFSFDR